MLIGPSFLGTLGKVANLLCKLMLGNLFFVLLDAFPLSQQDREVIVMSSSFARAFSDFKSAP